MVRRPTFLSHPGQGVVHNCGSHSIGLDVVVLVVHPEVDELLLRPPHQHIASVHVTVLKLDSLQPGWEGQSLEQLERTNQWKKSAKQLAAHLLCNAYGKSDLPQNTESLFKRVVLWYRGQQ